MLQQQFENEHQKENDGSESSQNVIADFKEKLASTREFYENLRAKADQMFLDISELKAQMNVAPNEDSEQNSEIAENLITKCNEIINE